jgi:hypothetical protein
MRYKAVDNEIWSADKGDWISSKYYDKQELLKQMRKRNLILMGAFAAYLIISAAFILF